MSLDKNKGIDENQDKTKKQNKSENKQKLIKTFCDNKMKDKSKKNNFLDSVFDAKEISGELKESLNDELTGGKSITSILDSNGNNAVLNIYEGVNINDISIIDLKSKLSSEYIPLKSKRDNLKLTLESEFDLSSKGNNKIIDDSIKKLSDIELYVLLKSSLNRKEFILGINSDINEKEKNLADFLKFDTRSLSTDAIKVIDRVQSKFIKGTKINSSDISALLNDVEFSMENKRKIINSFIPTITLKEAIEWGIKTKEDGEVYKQVLMSIYLPDINDVKSCYFSLKDEDIILSTKLHANLDFQINEIIKNSNFDNITEYFNSAIDRNIQRIQNISEENTESVINEAKSTNNNSINTINGVINELTKINSSTGQFENINKLEEGNIMKLTKKSETAEDIIQYVLIKKTDDENKQLTFLKVGSQSDINLSLDGEGNTISYSEFVNNFKKSKTKLNFFTKKEIEEQIEDPTNDELNNSDLKLFTHDDLKDFEVRKKYKDHYLDKLKLEIEDLKEELRKKGGKPEDNPLLVAQIEEKENYLKGVDVNYDLDNDKLLKFLNFRKFVEKLDKIDSKGAKFGFQKGVFFESGGTSYEITGVDENNQISLNSVAGREGPIDLETFYQVFKKNKASRVETIKDFDSIIDARKGDDKKWDKHEIVNGKIIAKGVEDGDEKGDRNVDYLVSTKNNEVVKINSIVGNTVFVQFGDRKDLGDLSEDEKKKDKIGKDAKGEKIYLDSTEHQISLNELNNYIDEFSLHPDWKVGKTLKPSEPKDLQNKYDSKFSTRLFNKTSINEIIAGGTMFIEGFKESIKTGNDVHAAKVALAMGSILPEEIKQDLQIKVERAEAEEMDKALEGLGKVDSPIATGRIKGWLLNKDTPEYKKEAGVLFMLDKYGHLTAKGPLYEFRGKFLWYEALGGRINDALYLSVKEEAERSNITFSEEYLVHILLKRQCSGALNPKRRSRLHKEYEGKWKNGIKEEFDKGYGDAEKKRTAADMVKGGNGEALGGTTSNAIGWYKKAIERGDSLEKMSEGFFALLYSGALYDVDQATFLKIKGLWDGDKMPIIMTRFSSYKGDMELFNETVLELSKKMEKLYPQHKGILSEAQSLFDDAKSSKGKEKDRFKRAIDFWKKYGTPLSRALNFSNNDDPTYAETDKIIFLEKDENPIFSNYYNQVRSFTTEGTFGKDFMDDACGVAGLSGLNVNELTKQYLGVSQNRNFKDPKTGNIVWNEIQKDLLKINSKTFYKNDPKKDREAKQQYLLHIFNDLLAGIASTLGGDLIDTYNNNQMNIGKYFNSIGLKLKEDFKEFSVSDFEGWSKPENKNSKSNVKLLKIINNILDGKTDDISKIDNESIDDKIINEDPFDEIISESKKTVDKVTSKKTDKKEETEETETEYDY